MNDTVRFLEGPLEVCSYFKSFMFIIIKARFKMYYIMYEASSGLQLRYISIFRYHSQA